MATQLPPKRVDAQTRPATVALVAALEDAVQEIIGAVAACEHPELVRVDDWTVKDTLGHIAFWHESFARNVAAMTEGRAPDVLAGSYPDLNQRGIEMSRGQSAAEISERILTAQRLIRRRILKLPADAKIPYRIGSRDYAPDEHLAMVRGHILAHLHRIERAARRRAAMQA